MKWAIIGLQVLIVGGLILGAVLLLTLGGDSDAKTSTTAASVPTPRLERFEGDRAWKELLRQVKVGPRPAGSAALQAESERLRAKLPRGRIEPVGGGLRNVVGSLPGRAPAV